MNRISTDIGGVGTLVDSSVMSIISYVLQIISGIIGLFVIDWKLAVLVLAIVPVKYLLIRFFSKRKEEAVAEWIQESTDFSAWFGDTINGMREVKLWNLYKKERRELRRRQKKVLELGKRSNLLETYNLSGDSILQWTVTSALYGIGGYLICGGSLTIGGLTAFISYSNYVIGPIALVFNLKFLFAQVKPSAKRLREFFKLETEKPSKPGQDIKELKEEIRFENVDFAYEDQPVLKDISLKIRKGEKIVAIVAPSILGQFKTTIEQVYGALKAVGFTDVIEVAQGAMDTVSNEAHELIEKLEEGQKFMTTSCCPAYIELVDKHIPGMKPYVSGTGSPMYYAARIAKEKHPDAKVVFIGPCVAKRKEAQRDEAVDFVMTFEEVASVLDGLDIQLEQSQPYTMSFASVREAHGFAQAGGVMGAVKAYLKKEADKINAIQVANLDKKTIGSLRAYAKSGKAPGQFIEVMACEGGCITGPCTHNEIAAGKRQFVQELAKQEKTY